MSFLPKRLHEIPRLAVLLALASCGPEQPDPPRDPGEPHDESAPEVIDLATLTADTDRRELTDAVRAGLTNEDPAVRRAATTAVARLQDRERFPLLRRGLRDSEASVRDAASMGIGELGADAPEDAVRVLAGALAAETVPAVRTAMVRDLGRLGTRASVMVLLGALSAEAPAERAAACLGIAERGIQAHAVPSSVTRRMAAILSSSEPDEVRIACAFALGRLPLPTDAAAAETVGVSLGLAVLDPLPDVRRFAVKALGRLPSIDLELLVNVTRDTDWQVAVQAHRSLSARLLAVDGGARVAASLLGAAADRLLDDDGHVQAGGPLHVFLAEVALANPHARAGPVYDLAAELHGRLGGGESMSRDRALAHCAAAALVDRGRGWPSRIEECGGDAISEPERQVMEAEILSGLEGAEPQRLVRLRRLFARETPIVREAVMAAAPSLLDPDAIALVLEGVRVDDAGVRPTALTALATIARRRPTADTVPPPLPVDEVLEALEAAFAGTPQDELETLVSWLDAVDAAEGRRLVAEVSQLALHPNHAVRRRARALLSSWEEPIPSGEVPAPSNPIDPSALPSAEERPRVRLETARGPIVLELRPDVAPVTVSRFLSLVEDGFYDGTRFHRVVSAFVIQAGDPRSDGYGGPGWAQRCEDHRLPYERGTVGMALAGRDTGGSQFFITHSRQPHLDGRYTAFAQVVIGLETVDLVQPGDPIQHAEIVSN